LQKLFVFTSILSVRSAPSVRLCHIRVLNRNG